MPAPSDVDVSVIIPARDAATTLRQAVSSALEQQGVGRIEVVVVVAAEDEGTHRVALELAAADTRVAVVANPTGTTPAALNRGIAASRGDVVVRLDAHAELPPGYVATARDILVQTEAGNVGGRQVPRADSGFGAAVAAAMRSPLGSGGAAYRSGTRAGPVETVYLGVFRREALEAVGGFDESLLRNQDYELNFRLREAGWTVWFDPRLAVAYRPRGTVPELARQYGDYGRYKRLVMRRHPRSIRLRQLAPLAMVSGTTGAAVVGAATGAWWLPAAAVGGYGALCLLAALQADPRRAASVVVALATMHWSWAVGFIRGPGHAGQGAAMPARQSGHE